MAQLRSRRGGEHERIGGDYSSVAGVENPGTVKVDNWCRNNLNDVLANWDDAREGAINLCKLRSDFAPYLKEVEAFTDVPSSFEMILEKLNEREKDLYFGVAALYVRREDGLEYGTDGFDSLVNGFSRVYHKLALKHWYV